MSMFHKLTLTALLGFSFSFLQAQKMGKIKGRILDNTTNEPLIGATILLIGSPDFIGTATDVDGYFELSALPFGTYSIQLKHIGYKTKNVNDMAVYDTNGVFTEVALEPTAISLDEAVVSAYENPIEPTDNLATVSARSISVEETKRFAGSLGDPARMALSYSGVNNSGGDNNEIIIRGNSAKYLQWKLEGLEIPNPNHFGVYGSSGGLLNILNANNLGRSNFYLGAFPAHTGNVIGGVFDLSVPKGWQSNQL